MRFNASKFNSHWQNKKLAELGTFQRGKSRHRPRNDPALFEGGIYPLVQTGEIKENNLYVRSHTAMYNDFGLAQSRIWPENTLCITIAANIAETALLGYPMCFPDSIVGFNAYPNESSELFMHYVFTYIRKAIQNSASGSIQDNINIDYLTNLDFKIPNKLEQDKIAGILASIDTKIELNNKINHELEAMAKFIYDYWFVQFDFPDVNGKPYKSSGGKMVFNEVLKQEIPEGWSVKEIGELVKFERGLSYKSKEIVDDGVPMINLNSFDLTGKYKEKGLKYFSGSYNEKKVVSPGDLVIAVTDVTRNADIIGKAFTIPHLFNKDVLISCDVAKIVPSTLIDEQFLEMLFNSDNYHNYIKYFASGTLVLHLNLDGVKYFKIPLPPKSLLNKYREIRKNINSKITIAIKENVELERLRDWLIPMLMNGQIIVK